MLNKFFLPGTILYRDSVQDWREAVDEVTDPLLKLGTIRPEYVDAIKKSIAGPGGTYIDLGSNIALAHSRPEAGVLKTSLSVLHLHKPFLLADSAEHPITTMFCLAAEDSSKHLDLMKALAGLLNDEEKRNKLSNVSNEEELRRVLTEEGQ